MKKDDIIKRLQDAAVQIPANAKTIEALTLLAKANNVDLSEAPAGGAGNAPPAVTSDAPPAVTGDAPPATVSETATADRKIAELYQAGLPVAPVGFPESAILEKTRLGLTRPQAIEILAAQAEHDARLAGTRGEA